MSINIQMKGYLEPKTIPYYSKGIAYILNTIQVWNLI